MVQIRNAGGIRADRAARGLGHHAGDTLGARDGDVPPAFSASSPQWPNFVDNINELGGRIANVSKPRKCTGYRCRLELFVKEAVGGGL